MRKNTVNCSMVQEKTLKTSQEIVELTCTKRPTCIHATCKMTQ